MMLGQVISIVAYAILHKSAISAVLIVDNTTDGDPSLYDCPGSGICNLRSAWTICTNITSVPEDTCSIMISPGLNLEMNSTLGSLPLNGGERISLVGSGDVSIGSDGNAVDGVHARFITYFPAVGNGLNVSLSITGVTITGFGRLDSSGGAIYFRGEGSLQLRDCTFRDNVGNNGGAVFLREATNGTLIEGCTFDHNQAAGSGGSIAITKGMYDVTISNTVVHNCTSGNAGGGIYIGDGNQFILIDNTTVSDCTSALYGGGISVGQVNYVVFITNSRLLSNSAYLAGGLYVWYSNAVFQLLDTEIAYCGAVYGGAFMFEEANDITVSGATIHDCASWADGGCGNVEMQNHHLSISQSTFENCAAGPEGFGGALYMGSQNSDCIISDSMFRHSSAHSGGGLYIAESNLRLQLQRLHVEDCHSTGENGGGIMITFNNGNAVLSDLVIANCSAFLHGGGLMVGTENHNFRLRNSQIVGNSANGGGGVCMYRNYHVRLRNNIIAENVAAERGGGLKLHLESYDTMVDICTLRDNEAWEGGAIAASEDTHQLTISGSQLISNRALKEGGGIFLEGGNDQFLLTDTATAATVQVLETEHPYDVSGADPNRHYDEFEGRFVQTWDVSVKGAVAYVLQFDPRCDIGIPDAIVVAVNGTEIFHGVYTVEWPGITQPALRVESSNFSVWFITHNVTSPRPTRKSDNLFGIALYVVPVLQQPGDPSVLAFNTAKTKGGAISMPYGVNFARIANAVLKYNTAEENGGGVVVQYAASGITVEGTLFEENEAGGNGGALVLEAVMDSIEVRNCVFDHNSAGNSGGAVALMYANGVDVILDVNTAFAALGCMFTNNSATRGGALFLDQRNVATIVDCAAVQNHAIGSGGAIHIETENAVRLEGCILQNNKAGKFGGGVATVAGNAMVLHNVTVIENKAGTYGGGICLMEYTELTVDGMLLVQENAAEVLGGGMAVFHSPLWERGNGSALQFVGNAAPRGSALYFKALQQGSTRRLDDESDGVGDSLKGARIADNVATVGGTVYWLFDSDMTSEPEGVNSSSVVWEGNVALYGERVATQAIQVQGPTEYEVQVFGQALDPPLEFELYDYYGQNVPIQGPTTVTATLVSTDREQCGGRTPFLSGSQAEEFNGTSVFDRLESNCAPEGEVPVRFTAALLDLQEAVEVGTLDDYALTKTVTMKYRSCRRGEFIQDGQCVTCPTGTYSLEYPVTQDTACVDCTGKSGVVTCHGNVIKVSGGYWRRHNTSEAVLDCLGDVSGCAGGEGTGDALCEEGYEGPLCAVCADGYYSSSGVCELCSGDTKLNTTTIVFLGIAGLVIMVAIFAFYAKCLDGEEVEEDSSTKPEQIGLQRYTTKSWIQQQFQDMRAQLKIVITTYQIVSEVPGNLNVEFPSKFTSFLRAFSVFNLNVISVVPFSCTRHYTFIDKLVATTLFPIGLSLLLALLCAADVARLTYMRISNGKDTKEKITAVKDQYLTYFFFLTYLVLPSVSTTIFQTFLCTNVDPRAEDNDKYDTYLIADMSISCTSSYYYRGVAYAVAMLLVYVVGIPLMYFLLLYYNREAIAGRDDVPPPSDTAGRINAAKDTDHPAVDAAQRKLPVSVKRLSFLWDAYEPQFWYWEVVETTRRLMLTAVLSICGAGTSAQSIFAVLLGLMYIKLYSFFAPYEDDRDDVVAEVGQFQIFFTFLGALIYQNSLLGSQWNDAVSAVLIFINATVTVLFFYYGVRSVQEQWEERKEYFRLRAEKQDENGEVELCARGDDEDDDSRQQETVRTQRIAAAVGPTATQQYARQQDRDEVMEAALRVQRTSEHVGEDNTDALDGADVICNADVIRDYF